MAAMSPADNARRFVHRKSAWHSLHESIEAHRMHQPGPRESGFLRRPQATLRTHTQAILIAALMQRWSHRYGTPDP